MRIPLITATCLFTLGCGPGAPRPNVTPSNACQDVAAVDTPAIQSPLVIDAKAFAAVTTPENVADITRALDALLQASRACNAQRLQEHA